MPQRRSSGPKEERQPRFQRDVYRLVKRVPRGKVVTYGQVAAILGHPRAARAVGQALRMLPRSLTKVVPWHRVINAAGGISRRGDPVRPELQRRLLENEGVHIGRGGRIDLKAVLWRGPRTEMRSKVDLEM